jgi:hypothetical protein
MCPDEERLETRARAFLAHYARPSPPVEIALNPQPNYKPLRKCLSKGEMKAIICYAVCWIILPADEIFAELVPAEKRVKHVVFTFSRIFVLRHALKS